MRSATDPLSDEVDARLEPEKITQEEKSDVSGPSVSRIATYRNESEENRTSAMRWRDHRSSTPACPCVSCVDPRIRTAGCASPDRRAPPPNARQSTGHNKPAVFCSPSCRGHLVVSRASLHPTNSLTRPHGGMLPIRETTRPGALTWRRSWPALSYLSIPAGRSMTSEKRRQLRILRDNSQPIGCGTCGDQVGSDGVGRSNSQLSSE